MATTRARAATEMTRAKFMTPTPNPQSPDEPDGKLARRKWPWVMSEGALCIQESDRRRARRYLPKSKMRANGERGRGPCRADPYDAKIAAPKLAGRNTN